MNLRQLLEERADEYGQKHFLFYREEAVSYERINRLSNQVAHAFLAAGIKKGDKVALMLPNCPEFLYIWFGLSKIGAVEVLVNTQFRGDFLMHQIEITDSVALVLCTDYLEAYLEVQKDLHHIRRIVLLKGEKPYSIPDGLACDDFWESCGSCSEDPPPDVEMKASDPVSIMFTSGTTGPSKAVLNSHKAYIRCGRDCAELVGLKNGDRCYCILPLYHGNPQMMAVMSALCIGGSLALRDKFSASAFFDDVRKYQCTYFTYVGTVLTILSKRPERQDDADNPLRLCFGGGAPSSVWEQLERRFRFSVHEAYGMIEAGCVTTINRLGRQQFGSIGIPRDCFDVRIVDEEDEELPPGETGEIVVRPNEPFVMFDGYYGMPEETLDAYRNLWFHTGDRARKDDNGYFYFAGRVKHTIRRKGENISSDAIENVINNHPDILESAVVGVPDEVAEEEIKAYIVLRKGCTLAPEDIIGWCSKGLPEFMLPRYIEFRDFFEKTGSEKIQKFKLEKHDPSKTWDRMCQLGTK